MGFIFNTAFMMYLNAKQLSPLEGRCSLLRCLSAESDFCYIALPNAEQNDPLGSSLSMEMTTAKTIE